MNDAEFLTVASDLIRGRHTEDKLAGILLIQEILIPKDRLNWRTALVEWGTLFETGAIADWNVCDWFCVKVLGPLSEREGEPCARAIAAWHDSVVLWQRRASIVAFVNLVKRKEELFPGFVSLLLANCDVLLESQERFSQTAVGWVLREMSSSRPETVRKYVLANRSRMSHEALQNATKKFTPADRKHLVESNRSTRDRDRTRTPR